MASTEPLDQTFDLVVIGGGVNGVGIARDAAGRGLKVLLCEKDDLASGTSSASTKLIHGGLRYLEHYAFALVRHALIEREVLLRAAPHIIWPLQFVLPHSPEQRPAWLIRLGLLLYDHLGGRKILPASKAIDLRRHPAGGPILDQFKKAFVYSDCWVEDSRLVALNALDAAERGAEVLTRMECQSARRGGAGWQVELRHGPSGQTRTISARALVNTAGPWVTEVLTQRIGRNLTKNIRNVKGSHIVVPRLFDHPYPYIFQNVDKRVLFAIPYEGRFTLIGTTDLDYEGDLDRVAITEGEIDYLCQAVNRYFERKISAEDVVWTYAGVRPLYDDGAGSASQATRDFILELESEGEAAPLLNVYGGKITTYRVLAEQAVDKLRGPLGFAVGGWTEHAHLPGGDMERADFESFLATQRSAYPWMPDELLDRYARSYGTRMNRILEHASRLEDLGKDLGGSLHEAEVDYLVDQEFARCPEDILWRRSKLGLHVPEGTAERITDYLNKGLLGNPPPGARSATVKA
ncbi:MAG: glycerol-3-phosphate dehydrogenase [Pseudomonadota bacterium]